jgi:hypothetical protein
LATIRQGAADLKPFETAVLIASLTVALWTAIHAFEADLTDPREVYHFGNAPISSDLGERSAP